MTLTLTVANVDQFDNGSPVSFAIDRRDVTIGRSPACDWTLPDPRHHVSSRHCQVAFRDGGYVVTDVSTNGTLLNGARERMAAPRRIETGDRFQIGPFEIVATLAGGSTGDAPDPWRSRPAPAAPGPAASPWDSPAAAGAGWDRPVGGGWDRPAGPLPIPAASPPIAPPWPDAGAIAAASQQQPPWPGDASAAWLPAPPAAEPFDWHAPPAPPSEADWPAAVGDAAGSHDPRSDPSPAMVATADDDDVWARFAGDNAVDWARGGFGVDDDAAPMPAAGAGPGATRDIPARSLDPIPGADGPASTALVDAFVTAAGLRPDQLKASGVEMIERAAGLLRQLVGGLVVMVEARARAKSQMGAEATSLDFEGNNPIKFARSPDQALAQLLNPKERGFMAADAAVEDAFRDLQSHQIATLKAMQGALRATLDRFSPAAIRSRADARGLLGRILPGAREAALWQAYEREFGGVAQGSDEAFMDVFAKEFRRAYQDQEQGPRRG